MTDRNHRVFGRSDQWSDRDLVDRILQCDDAEAKDSLWWRYNDDVERIIRRYLFNPRQQDVQDIAVEVWIAVFDADHLSQWHGDAPSLRPWLRSIARNKATDFFRRIRDTLWGGDPDELPEASASSLEESERAEIARARLMEAVYRIAEELTPSEQEAFLAWLDGANVSQYARDHGRMPNAVHQTVDRAKRKVFRRLLYHDRDVLPERYQDMPPRKEWRDR